jgi:DNA-directed RNA polymerase specialized sigma24 family protein
VTDRTLTRARPGDEEAFRELTDPYRSELQLHCYRILGSVQDAEDLLQETLLAAWRGLERFECAGLATRVALSNRDQPLPERVARQRAPSA